MEIKVKIWELIKKIKKVVNLVKIDEGIVEHEETGQRVKVASAISKSTGRKLHPHAKILGSWKVPSDAKFKDKETVGNISIGNKRYRVQVHYLKLFDGKTKEGKVKYKAGLVPRATCKRID